MAAKISKIILKVDLEFSHCNKKIKRTLCKYQDRWNIKSIVYDEKKNTVTITGPFDPKKFIKKLCCEACKAIKDIQIVEDKPRPSPPPDETKPAPPPEPACPPGWPYGNGPPCCCWYHGTCRCCTYGRGCGPYGGYGLLPVAVVTPPAVVYGGWPCCDGYKTCELICEEGNSCMIM